MHCLDRYSYINPLPLNLLILDFEGFEFCKKGKQEQRVCLLFLLLSGTRDGIAATLMEVQKHRSFASWESVCHTELCSQVILI